MSLKAMICPQCGANIECEDSLEYGFCSYCGAKIQLHEVIEVKHSGTVSITNDADINRLISNCEAQLKFQDYRKAYSYAQTLITKYSNEPKGYMLSILSLTSDFDINMYDLIDENIFNEIKLNLSKLKKLDSSCTAFEKKTLLFLEITDKYNKLQGLTERKNTAQIQTNNQSSVFFIATVFYFIFAFSGMYSIVKGLVTFKTTSDSIGDLIFGIILLAVAVIIFIVQKINKRKFVDMANSKTKTLERNIRQLEEDIQEKISQLNRI